MANSEVILIENIPGLGAEADVVKVKKGYARNYLIPFGKALEKTPSALRSLNHLKAKRAEREAGELNKAEELGRKIGKLKITMLLETGETGKAFGSITVKDITERVQAELGGIEFERGQIVLERPIKETGAHEIPIKLHHDVTAKLNITVKSKSEPEAEPAKEAAAEPGEQTFKSKPKARHAK